MRVSGPAAVSSVRLASWLLMISVSTCSYAFLASGERTNPHKFSLLGRNGTDGHECELAYHILSGLRPVWIVSLGGTRQLPGRCA